MRVWVVDEVGGSLFGRDSDQWHSFVRGLEPDDLRAFGRRSSFILLGSVTFSLSSLDFLLLLRRSRRRAKNTELTGEELSWHAFDLVAVSNA